jgi:hypothetical protein
MNFENLSFEEQDIKLNMIDTFSQLPDSERCTHKDLNYGFNLSPEDIYSFTNGDAYLYTIVSVIITKKDIDEFLKSFSFLCEYPIIKVEYVWFKEEDYNTFKAIFDTYGLEKSKYPIFSLMLFFLQNNKLKHLLDKESFIHSLLELDRLFKLSYEDENTESKGKKPIQFVVEEFSLVVKDTSSLKKTKKKITFKRTSYPDNTENKKYDDFFNELSFMLQVAARDYLDIVDINANGGSSKKHMAKIFYKYLSSTHKSISSISKIRAFMSFLILSKSSPELNKLKLPLDYKESKREEEKIRTLIKS